MEIEHNAVETTSVQHLLMGPAGHLGRSCGAGTVAEVDRCGDPLSAGREPQLWPLRTAHYSADNADYLRNANERMLVSCIPETTEAVSALKEMWRSWGLMLW